MLQPEENCNKIRRKIGKMTVYNTIVKRSQENMSQQQKKGGLLIQPTT